MLRTVPKSFGAGDMVTCMCVARGTEGACVELQGLANWSMSLGGN